MSLSLGKKEQAQEQKMHMPVQSTHIKKYSALAGVAQWIELRPASRRVTGSILSQGTSLGCGLHPHCGACERQLIDQCISHTSMFLSLSFCFPSPLQK